MTPISLIDPVSPLRSILQQQADEWRRRVMNPPDPDALTGPPPTFDVSPIQRLYERGPAHMLDEAETAMPDPARDVGPRPRIDIRL